VPPYEGPYRLYVTVADGKGGVGVANAPFLVEAPKNPPAAPGEDSSFHLGDFYESPVTDGAALSTDVVTSVWDQSSQLASVRNDVAEGDSAQRAITGDKGWLGFGVSYTTPIDATAWKTLRVSLRSTEKEFEAQLTITIGDEAQVKKEDGSNLVARDYGFKSDGKWHALAIPLSDFVAVEPLDLSRLSLGFGLSVEKAARGQAVDVDGLHLTAQ
jgi:hypothetical protein